jgi:single-strand DNA-binding protein
MNKVMLAGRITKPVELKSLPSGSKVAVGSVATHDFRGGEERTEFHRLVFWEKLAEIAAAHLLADAPPHSACRETCTLERCFP